MKTEHRTKAKAAAPAQVKLGASAALTRLEGEEARLFGLLKEAEAEGDPLETKAARDAWLRVSESLRKFDLIVESAKRELGETVPRAHVEDLLQNVGQLLHWALCKASDMQIAWEVTDNTFQTLIAGYDPRRSAPIQECPKWMYQALFKHGQWRRPKELEQQLVTIRAIAEGIARYRDDEKKFFGFLKSNIAPIPPLPI